MVKQRTRAIARAFKHVSLRQWLLLAVVTALLVGLGVGGWGLTQPVQAEETAKAPNPPPDSTLEWVKVAISGAGTLATIAGGVVLYLNFRVANKNAETAIKTVEVANRNAEIANKNAEIASKTAELTESRLVTERFSKAVEQLGSDKLEVRLGGIYALERIAQDSKRDHWTIMEVLTAFVREKSPVAATPKAQVKRSFVEQALQSEEPKNKPTQVSQDVHAASTVIGRRVAEQDPHGKYLDLSGSNLRDANLRNANFCNANLNKANLAHANLRDANLSGADLRGANLTHAILGGAILRGTDLNSAILSHAWLRSAGLEGANLILANLEDAYLEGANLIIANLSFANLRGARNLTDEQLKKAFLCHTTLPDGTVSNRDCGKMGVIPPTERKSYPPTPPSPPLPVNEPPASSESPMVNGPPHQ